MMRNPLSVLSLCALFSGLGLTNSVFADATSEQKLTPPTSGDAKAAVASGANAGSIGAKIDAYLEPFATTNNFAGSVIVVAGDSLVFAKSYGFADRETQIPNRLDTRFHIASMSMQFTAAAAMRLVETGKLSLDSHVADIVPGLPNGERITVRELLNQNSGLPDANDLPNYDDLLKAHQTPESLVQAIRGQQPFAEPGGKSQHEEHSAFNVLALIVEKKTGLPFAQAVRKEVFDPLGMGDSGIDDDSPIGDPVAVGYQLSGTYGLKRADPIHWSAKTGNGSAYSTVNDERKWLQAFFADKLFSAATRATMLDYGTVDEGFGWGKVVSPRFGELELWSSGRSPGFCSSLIYLPKEKLGAIVLTNIETAHCPIIVRDVVLIAVGKPYESFQYRRVELSDAERRKMTGRFQFGPDFFRPNGTLEIAAEGQDLILQWPGGPDAPLLPIAANAFMDRYYWTRATLPEAGGNAPAELDYGEYVGKRVPAQMH
jgi:CubicO group peptidase (beta-lactamase class C family)